MCKPYYNEDKTAYAMLISYGYGSGWSTDNYDAKLAWDSRVVEYWMKIHENEDYIRALTNQDSTLYEEIVKQFEEWGYEDVYFGGFMQIKLRWVPINTYARIGNYDGAEYLETFDPRYWVNFNGEDDNEG